MASGHLSRPFKMASDQAGYVYLTGQAKDAAGITHWITRRRDLAGVWQTVDDFSSTQALSRGFHLLSDSTGLYATGTAPDGSSQRNLTIRHGTENGTQWTTLLSYKNPNYLNSAGLCFIKTRNRVLIAMGQAQKVDSTIESFALRSSDNGQTWDFVDNYPGGLPQSCFQSSTGTLYMSGIVRLGTAYRLLVRQSLDDGQTWSLVEDSLPPENGNWFVGHQFVEDASGAIYLVTDYGLGAEYQRTLIKKKSCETCSFEDFDLYAGVSPRRSSAAHTADIINGALVIGGYELTETESDCGSYVREIGL